MDLSNCEIVVERLVDNCVEVRKILYDKAGKEVILETEAYSRNRIIKEKSEIQKHLDFWNNVVPDVEKSKEQLKLDRLDNIQTVMDTVPEK